MRELPATIQGMARLIGALEALEEHCRQLAATHDSDLLDGIRSYLQSIDQLEAAGRFVTALPENVNAVSPSNDAETLGG